MAKKASCSAPCLALCPLKAITIDDSISIDSSKCISCNLCTISCPHGVFNAKIPSDGGLCESILAARKNGKEVIRFACDRCGGRYGKVRRKRMMGEEAIVLPCLGSLPETLPFYAMRLECEVVIDPCAEDCGLSEGRKCYELAMKRWNNIRESFVMRPIDASEETSRERNVGLERRDFLLSGGEEIMKLMFDLEEPRGGERASSVYRRSLPPRRRELLILTQGLEPRSRNVTSEDYPILDLQVSREPCNLCEVCSKLCPSGALRYSEGGDMGSIAFTGGKCTGCRLCIEACPKGCISSSDADLGALNSGEKILVERQIYRCRSCDFRFVRDGSSAAQNLCPLCEKKRNLVA